VNQSIVASAPQILSSGRALFRRLSPAKEKQRSMAEEDAGDCRKLFLNSSNTATALQVWIAKLSFLSITEPLD